MTHHVWQNTAGRKGPVPAPQGPVAPRPKWRGHLREFCVEEDFMVPTFLPSFLGEGPSELSVEQAEWEPGPMGASKCFLGQVWWMQGTRRHRLIGPYGTQSKGGDSQESKQIFHRVSPAGGHEGTSMSPESANKQTKRHRVNDCCYLGGSQLKCIIALNPQIGPLTHYYTYPFSRQ